MRDTLFEDIEAVPSGYGSVHFDRDELIHLLSELRTQEDIAVLRNKTRELKRRIDLCDPAVLTDGRSDGNVVSLRKDVVSSELSQILEARTIERAKYYVKRLELGVKKVKTSAINDINLHRWKEYTEIITDSLWVLPKRDTTGAHLGWYWGNFIPQIPHQLMLRYTKRGDWVLDPFVGSGTTLIECRRLGRNGIGIELNEAVAQRARELVHKEKSRHQVKTEIFAGDAQLLIMHPPYHDIISFSDDANDLSNADSTSGFVRMFAEALDNWTPVLECGRYFGLVIGDKYSKGEWVPLGFHCMNAVLDRQYSLKSIIVKNFDETRAKREQKQLWRYRALVGGFYIFKHEYIFLFRKN